MPFIPSGIFLKPFFNSLKQTDYLNNPTETITALGNQNIGIKMSQDHVLKSLWHHDADRFNSWRNKLKSAIANTSSDEALTRLTPQTRLDDLNQQQLQADKKALKFWMKHALQTQQNAHHLAAWGYGDVVSKDIGIFRVKTGDPLAKHFKPGIHLVQKRVPGCSFSALVQQAKDGDISWNNLKKIQQKVTDKTREIKSRISTGRFDDHDLTEGSDGNVIIDIDTGKFTYIDLAPPLVTIPKPE